MISLLWPWALAALPLPFQLLGIEPRHWTEEVVISRHQGLLGNIGLELSTARAVCTIGADKVRELRYFHPHQPDLSLDPMIDCESLLENDILGLYNAYRRGLNFQPEDLFKFLRSKVSGSDQRL